MTTNATSASTAAPLQFPFSSQAPVTTGNLPPLALVTEPIRFSNNQQQMSVGTFQQRSPPTTNTTGRSSTAEVTSPFSGPFAQAPVPSFSFQNSSLSNVPNFTFAPSTNGQFTPNQQPDSSAKIQPFQFASAEPKIMPSAPATSPTTNQTQRSPANVTQTSPTLQSSSNQSGAYAVRNKEYPSPTTPLSEEPSLGNQQPNDEADGTTAPAYISLLGKMINTTLRDPRSLEVERSDPNSPLYSCQNFQDLNLRPDLLKGIYNMGFSAPSKIQTVTLPPLLSNPPRNIIAQSQSGTGKTAAFSLVTISRIDPAIQSPQALILAPTFELALQIGSVIEQMARFIPYIKIAYAVRDVNISKREQLVRGQLLTEPIVIGTPGTVEEYCHKKRVINLRQLRMCVIDEADIMISTEGFQQMCANLVRDLDQSRCQMMLFSATYNDEVMNFAREVIPNPLVLRLKREKQTLNNIRQYFIYCNNVERKYEAIQQIYASLTIGQAMIFCRTKVTARDLAIRMTRDNHSVGELTAALDMEMRASVIKRFREGKFRVLISTNVMARGIDIDDVSLVINYDMPVDTQFQPDFETYLHRIGRCGRFGKLGYTFNLIGSPKDHDLMKQIEAYFSHTIDEIAIEGLSALEEEHVN